MSAIVRWAGALLVLLTLVFSGSARAQSNEELAAEEARMASVHMKYSRFQAALEAYTRAEKLAHSPKYVRGMGECHQVMDQHKLALPYLERYVREEKDPAAKAEGEQLLFDTKVVLGLAQPKKVEPSVDRAAMVRAQIKAEAEARAKEEAAKAAEE